VPSDLLLAFAGFAFATSITPGPNNIMLMASGVNYGFGRSLPHMAGIATGFFIMLLLVGFGVGQLLAATPWLYLSLKIVSVIYLCWLAWRVATSGAVKETAGANAARPMNFIEAALFQWVNPKAWAMAVTAAAAYTVPTDYGFSLLLISVVYVLVGTPCMGVWTAFGVGMRSLLKDPARVRIFNIAMAGLLVASFVPIMLEIVQF